jgi:hypothetical protein
LAQLVERDELDGRHRGAQRRHGQHRPEPEQGRASDAPPAIGGGRSGEESAHPRDLPDGDVGDEQGSAEHHRLDVRCEGLQAEDQAGQPEPGLRRPIRSAEGDLDAGQEQGEPDRGGEQARMVLLADDEAPEPERGAGDPGARRASADRAD